MIFLFDCRAPYSPRLMDLEFELGRRAFNSLMLPSLSFSARSSRTAKPSTPMPPKTNGSQMEYLRTIKSFIIDIFIPGQRYRTLERWNEVEYDLTTPRHCHIGKRREDNALVVQTQRCNHRDNVARVESKAHQSSVVVLGPQPRQQPRSQHVASKTGEI